MSARSGKAAEIARISLDAIEVGGRLRTLNQERVAALAASIRELGLQMPITVFATPKGGGCATYRRPGRCRN